MRTGSKISSTPSMAERITIRATGRSQAGPEPSEGPGRPIAACRTTHPLPHHPPGLTLIEVVAAIAILGTVLVGITLSQSRHTRQLAAAQQQSAAAHAADQLISEWWTNTAGVPLEEQRRIRNRRPALRVADPPPRRPRTRPMGGARGPRDRWPGHQSKWRARWREKRRGGIADPRRPSPSRRSRLARPRVGAALHSPKRSPGAERGGPRRRAIQTRPGHRRNRPTR